MVDKKKCGKCQTVKPSDEFHKNNARKDGLQSNCKVCKAKIDSKNYQTNGGPSSADRQASKAMVATRNRQFILTYLETHPCVDCAESDIVVLQFDHQRDKVMNVAKMIPYYSIQSLVDEIAKCEVVCANCHTRRTARTFGWWRWSKEVVDTAETRC